MGIKIQHLFDFEALNIVGTYTVCPFTALKVREIDLKQIVKFIDLIAANNEICLHFVQANKHDYP